MVVIYKGFVGVHAFGICFTMVFEAWLVFVVICSTSVAIPFCMLIFAMIPDVLVTMSCILQCFERPWDRKAIRVRDRSQTSGAA